MHKKILAFILTFCMIFCFGSIAYAKPDKPDKPGTGQIESHLHGLNGICDNKAEMTISDGSSSYKAVLTGSTVTVYMGTTENTFYEGQTLSYEVKTGSNTGQKGIITVGRQEGNQGSEHDKGLNNYKCTYEPEKIETPPEPTDPEKPEPTDPPKEEGGGVIPPGGGGGDPNPPSGGGGIILPPITPIEPEPEIPPVIDEEPIPDPEIPPVIEDEEESIDPEDIEEISKVDVDNDPCRSTAYTPVKTGDMTQMTIWSIILAISVFAIGTIIYSSLKRREN